MAVYQMKYPAANSPGIMLVALPGSQFGAGAAQLSLAEAELTAVEEANEDLPVYSAQDLLKAGVLSRYTIRYAKGTPPRKRQKSFILPNRATVKGVLDAKTTFDGGTVDTVVAGTGRRKSDV